MQTWMEIADIYRQQIQQTPHVRQAQWMLRLVQQLRRHPDLVFVHRATTSYSPPEIDGLLLWLPDSAAMLHVDCPTPGVFRLQLDHRGLPFADDDPREVGNDQVIPTIMEQLRESRRV